MCVNCKLKYPFSHHSLILFVLKKYGCVARIEHFIILASLTRPPISWVPIYIVHKVKVLFLALYIIILYFEIEKELQ